MVNDSYLYMIVALLPLTALMLTLQVNPYHALVIRGILGAIAALVYVVLGAADVALTEANLADPILGPFLAGLDYAHTTRFYDEAGQRQVAIDMVNRVLLEGQSIEDSLSQAAQAEQAIIDQGRQ